MKTNHLLTMTLIALSAMMTPALSAPAFADVAPAASLGALDALGATMKDMAKQVMLITQNSADASKNAASAALCDTLLADIATARGLMPPKVQALPQSQQSGEMAQYQQAMDQLSAAVRQMKTDFMAGQNGAVTQDLAQIQAIKASGHQAFKGN